MPSAIVAPVIERMASSPLLIATAIASLALPVVFVGVVVAAGLRRRQDGQVGPALIGVVAVIGGLTLGTLLLFAPDLVIALPLLIVVGAIVVGRWRARRRVEAGWFMAGAGFPGTAVGSLLRLDPDVAADLFDAASIGSLAVSAVALVVGVVVALRGDPQPPPPAIEAPAGQPGSRSFGSIAEALRQPTLIGPFGQPEIATLVAMVVTMLVVPFLVPRGAPVVVHIAVLALASAVVGTEAYVRSMPTPSRRAFEAFSWLGEWELARARRVLGGPIPLSPRAAAGWLDANPAGPIVLADQLALRVEILLLAGRIDDARQLVERLPVAGSWERFEQAALRDLVDWRAGGDGDLTAMEGAAREIEPPDGDERLRAEVTIATARVRRLMADGRATAGDAIAPFLDVRERLGRRADGQVGRALRPRLLPMLLVLGVVFGVATLVTSTASSLPI
jgi:hypothetical protein